MVKKEKKKNNMTDPSPSQVSTISIILTSDAPLLEQPDVMMKDLFLHSAQGPFNPLPTADHVRQITHLNTYT